MELLYLINSLDKKVTKIIYSVAKSLGEVAIGFDAAIAEVTKSSTPSVDGCRKRS